jgi:hypothetical protein
MMALVDVIPNFLKLLVLGNRKVSGLRSMILFLCGVASVVIGKLWVVILQLVRFAVSIGSFSGVLKRLYMIRLEGVISIIIVSLVVGAIGVILAGSMAGLLGVLLAWSPAF